MSKGLRNIKNEAEKLRVIERRVREGKLLPEDKRGLGYWAAVDAQAKRRLD